MSGSNDDIEQDLTGVQAVGTLRDIIMAAQTCMMVTQHENMPFDARPMAVQGVDDSGTVWFLSAADSAKNRDIERDSRVTLLVQDNAKYQYAQVSGHATVHREKALIEQYWSAVANAWFDGKDDPRVTLLAVHCEAGQYWKTKNGKILTGVRMLLSAAGAKVGGGGVHGHLSV